MRQIVKANARAQIQLSLSEPDCLAIEIWLGNKAHTTRLTYKYYIKQFLEVMEIKQLELISLLHITSYEYWLNTQGYARATIATKLNILKSLISFLGKNELITEKQAQRISQHPVPKQEGVLVERLLEENEVLKLIAAATVKSDLQNSHSERDLFLLLTLVRLGLRASEIISIKWSNIRGNVLTLRGKGGKVRSLIIPDDLLEQWKAIRASDYVFCVSTGKPLSRARLHQIVKDLAKKAGINEHTSAHWLRHFHAVNAIQNGCPLHVLQVGLGHESLDTTKRYLHVLPTDCSSNYVSLRQESFSIESSLVDKN